MSLLAFLLLASLSWTADALTALVPSSLADTPAAISVPLRITGTVTSSRDGSPVARCTLTLTPAAPDEDRSGLEREGSPRISRPGNRAGNADGLGSEQLFSVNQITRGRPGGQRAGSQADELIATTDAQGRFTVAVPHAGAWHLAAVARGFRSQGYQQHEQFSTAVVLSANTPDLHVDFILKPSASISGFVLDEAGEAVAAGQVALQRKQPSDEPGAPVRWISAGFAQTDDRGHYESTGLPDGEYRLAVTAHPWYATPAPPRFSRSNLGTDALPASQDPSLDLVYPVTWFPGAVEERSAETLVMHAGEDRQADVHLQAVPAIHLTVPASPDTGQASEPGQPRGNPAPQVFRQSSTGSPFGLGGSITSVGRDGSWQIGGLSAGTYQVRTQDSAAGPGRLLEVTLAQGSASTVDLESAVPMLRVAVKVDGADAGDLRNVTLTNTSTGFVFSDAVRGRFRNRGADRSGDDGESDTRTIELPPGEYFVSATLVPAVSLLGISAQGAQMKGRTVRITDGSPTLTLQLRPGRSTLKGAVRQAETAVAGAMVLLVPASYGSPGSLAEVRRAQTATDGSFTLQHLPSGPYLLVALAHGWEVEWRDPATLAKYLAEGTPLSVPDTGTLSKTIPAVEP